MRSAQRSTAKQLTSTEVMLGSSSYEEVERLSQQLCGNQTPQAVREAMGPWWRTTCCEAKGTTSASQNSKEVSRWGADAGKLCQSLKPWQHRVRSAAAATGNRYHGTIIESQRGQ